MGAFTISSMANLFSRVAIAYALVYLTPLGGQRDLVVHSRRVAHWSDGISAPGEERKVDAQGSG